MGAIDSFILTIVVVGVIVMTETDVHTRECDFRMPIRHKQRVCTAALLSC
jgi:hypothetical protein